MYPNLIFLAGQLKGKVFEIIEEAVSIGRELSNQISITDRSLSRHHCVIETENGEFRIRDLGSHNGTFVNEIPAQQQPLAHGDRLQFGKSHAVFLTREEHLDTSDVVQFDSGTLATASTIKLEFGDLLQTLTDELRVLMNISSAISSSDSLPAMQKSLLEALFEIVPAVRGAIVFVDEDLAETAPAFVFDRTEDPSQLRISSTVAKLVMKENVAVLSNDLISDEALIKSESLFAQRISSLLCVPLALLGKSIGLIYLVTSDAGQTFSQRHLGLVSAISNFAAGALERIRLTDRLQSENKRLQEAVQAEHGLVGESAAIREVYGLISKVARTESTVLVRGETGTGKELVARAIHKASSRRGKPFVAINCAALSEPLLESELFGHEKGAFTGAIALKRGKLEIAEGGTLFLDEVGEMATSIQTKLLRVLQDHEFQRIGGTRTMRAEIRIIAATNSDLQASIAKGTFRDDLYYRLNVVPIIVPPLRERLDDVPSLAHYFLAKYTKLCNRAVMGLSDGACKCMMSYSWPGNVRELENCIERAIVLGSTDYIEIEDLPEAILEVSGSRSQIPLKYYELLQEAKKQIIVDALNQGSGNYTRAAEILGLHPSNLHRVIRNLNLKPSLTKNRPALTPTKS